MEGGYAVPAAEKHAASGNRDLFAIGRGALDHGAVQHRKRLRMQGSQAGGRIDGRSAGGKTVHEGTPGSSEEIGKILRKVASGAQASLAHLSPDLYERVMIALIPDPHPKPRPQGRGTLLCKSTHWRPIPWTPYCLA
ncbi:hypothetical protein D3C86_1762150 [compost metagenome]